MREISQEDSKKLGKKLSEEHPTTVYAMAQKASGFQQSTSITSCKVRSVKSDHCELALVTCRGDLCEMKTVQYPMVPPLESISDWTPQRIATLHVDACSPKVSWLMTTPLAVLILCLCSSISYGALVLGREGIVTALSSAPRLAQGIGSIFGSTTNFATAVVGAWWFQTLAHAAEACYVYQKSVTVLKLPTQTALQWAFLVLLVGFPIMSRILDLVQFQHQQASKKDS